ncbi:hypothetical protein P4O66_002930 [Electrophorus voltai]|uniref:Nuclear/hormone receptor activator site AF-1 domain-containing protein n=1 Tax=Electrophorus voltai TaxID=2609070 RepID=A0AAD8YX01_9TELE|nr:hypothetical protein P4O66_002930 [Electrophorus voltai]
MRERVGVNLTTSSSDLPSLAAFLPVVLAVSLALGGWKGYIKILITDAAFSSCGCALLTRLFPPTDASGQVPSPLSSPASHRAMHPPLLSPSSIGPSGSLHSPIGTLSSPMNGLGSPFSVISSSMAPHSMASPGMGYGPSVSPQVCSTGELYLPTVISGRHRHPAPGPRTFTLPESLLEATSQNKICLAVSSLHSPSRHRPAGSHHLRDPAHAEEMWARYG